MSRSLGGEGHVVIEKERIKGIRKIFPNLRG
jgi:hypothetical protein